MSTKIKIAFEEIITLDGHKLVSAPEGKRFIAYPSGKAIKCRNAKFLLYAGSKIYAGETVAAVVIAAHKDGNIDLFKHGYNTCHRCSGVGTLDHFFYTYGGICFKCRGLGIV